MTLKSMKFNSSMVAVLLAAKRQSDKEKDFYKKQMRRAGSSD